MNVKPDADEIARVEEWATDGDLWSHYPGMSYERGILDTLEWLQGRAPAPDQDE